METGVIVSFSCLIYTPSIILISVILGIFFVIKYFSNYKKDMITDNCIEIYRYGVTDFHTVSNIKISYKDVKTKRALSLLRVLFAIAFAFRGLLCYTLLKQQ